MTQFEKKLRLAIIYGDLLHYRIGLFNALCDHFEVTVYSTGFTGSEAGLRFHLQVIEPHAYGYFFVQPGLRKAIKSAGFDACVVFMDLSNMSAMSAIFFPIVRRTLSWGAWTTGNPLANFVRRAAVTRSEASIFYCHQHMQHFSGSAGNNRLYVAPNTVVVPENTTPSPAVMRHTILFVGSFAARKGLDRLVHLFSSLLQRLNGELKLVLVGDGPERASLVKLVEEMGLSDHVVMPGRVNDPERLASYYRSALVAVSLNQAGLSVLQSMGFGVPFLTVRESLSGGETTNIVNGVNGFIVENDDAAIIHALEEICSNPERSEMLGKAAHTHYWRYATMQNYAQGFIDAVEGTRMTCVWASGDELCSLVPEQGLKQEGCGQ